MSERSVRDLVSGQAHHALAAATAATRRPAASPKQQSKDTNDPLGGLGL
jgi:hypothetical protein